MSDQHKQSSAAGCSGDTNPVDVISTDVYRSNINQSGTHSIVVLENIEHRYIEVMQELSADPRFERLKLEYERIYHLLVKSHEGERRLVEKVRELRNELKDHESRISTALDLSKEDAQSITTLRKEIEKAWVMADTAHAREVESRELIQVLTKQVADLDEQVEQSAGLSMGQEVYLRNLIHSKKAREEEHAVLMSGDVILKKEHADCVSRMQQLTAKETETRQALESKSADYQALLSTMEVEQRERNAKEQSARNFRSTTEQQVVELEKTKRSVEQFLTDERRLCKDVEVAKDINRVLFRQLEERQQRIKTEADQLAATEQYNSTLKAQLHQKAVVIKDKQQELAKATKRLANTEAAAHDQQEQLNRLVQERDELITRANTNSETLATLLSELTRGNSEIRCIEATVKGVMQRKTKATAARSVKENGRTEMEGAHALEEGKGRRLEQELTSFLQGNEQLRKQVFELENKKAAHFSAAQSATLEYHKTLDAIRSKRTELKNLKERSAMLEKKQKAQQELVNRVKTDRNRAEKQLREMENEWQELMSLQQAKQESTTTIKKELVGIETTLFQLNTVNKQLQRDMANTEQRSKHVYEDGIHAKARVAALEAEARELEQIIAKCDAEKQKQLYKLKAVTNDCNILATQLIYKNEELSLIYDKVRLQASNLANKASDYDKRVGEIIDARDRLVELRLRCRRALMQLRYIKKAQKKALKCQRELNQQRTYVRALADELQNFVNVHRWRRLDGSAPNLLDALAKVQLLQRSYIEKSSACVELTGQIRKKVNEYTELRNRLTRLPGPEAVEDLALFQENIEKREGQLQGMSTELYNLEQHAGVLEDEVHMLTDELSDVKKKYYEAKMKQDFRWREARQWQQTWGNSSTVAQLAHETILAATRTFPGERNRSEGHPKSLEGFSYRRNGMPPCVSGLPHHLPTTGQQAFLSQRKPLFGASMQAPSALTRRKRAYAREEDLLHILSTGVQGPNFVLQKPKNQRQFTGGGFALTH